MRTSKTIADYDHPVILVAGYDDGYYQSARFGAAGQWLTVYGEPIATDRQVAVNAYGLKSTLVIAIATFLSLCGYRRIEIVEYVEFRNQTVDVRRGTWSLGPSLKIGASGEPA